MSIIFKFLTRRCIQGLLYFWTVSGFLILFCLGRYWMRVSLCSLNFLSTLLILWAHFEDSKFCFFIFVSHLRRTKWNFKEFLHVRQANHFCFFLVLQAIIRPRIRCPKDSILAFQSFCHFFHHFIHNPSTYFSILLLLLQLKIVYLVSLW